LRENIRLREMLAQRDNASGTQGTEELSKPLRCRGSQTAGIDDDDYYETVLFRVNLEQRPLGNLQQDDLIIPSRQCSQWLIYHNREWNSWVHYGVEYPHFENEHRYFMDQLESGGKLDDEDPSWLAIYFAVITVSLVCTLGACGSANSASGGIADDGSRTHDIVRLAEK
jgi:hypothetical protein